MQIRVVESQINLDSIQTNDYFSTLILLPLFMIKYIIEGGCLFGD